MPTEITALWGGRKVELRETQRAVTPFGGLVVFFEFLRQVGYVEVVNRCLPFRLASPNALDPAQTFTAFLLAVLAGARRFAHASRLTPYRQPATLRAQVFLCGALLGGAGRGLVLHLSSAWGGLHKRNPLLENVLRDIHPTSLKLHPEPVT